MTNVAHGVLVNCDRGVATVTLNRPEKLNALTEQMQRRYVDLLAELDADTAVRVIVVTGAGRGFCAGADLASLSDTERLKAITASTSVLPTVAIDVRKPLVAAVNGPVAGIGFALMLACDVRFIGASVQVATTFARMGLTAEYGVGWLLPRVIGAGRALELLLSGRPVGSDEALRIGLVHEVVSDRPVLDRALDWARDVAEHCSPASLAAIKQQVYGDLERPRAEALERSLTIMHESFDWADLSEALAARREARLPVFPDLIDEPA